MLASGSASGLGGAAAPETAGPVRGAALDVPAKHIVVAPDKGKLLILLDLFPFAEQLRGKSGKEAADIATATAAKYADLYSAKKEHASLAETTVMIVYVKNMDEYNRPNYGGMVRHGTLTFKRDASKQMKMIESKLDFKANP